MSSTKKGEQQFSLRKTLLTASYEASTFALTRYPYLASVLLMISTADRSRHEDIARKDFVYMHIAAYFGTATMMSYDLFGMKRVAALLACVQHAALCCEEFVDMRYGETIAFRMITRNFAIIAAYLLVAGGIAKNKGAVDRNKTMVTFGRQMLGAFAILSAVLIWNSEEEFSVWNAALHPLGVFASYAIMTSLMACGFAIHAGLTPIGACKSLALVVFVITILVDLNTQVWLDASEMRVWQVREMACKHIPALCALLLVRTDYC